MSIVFSIIITGNGGIFLTYVFYKLAISHRKLFVGIGGLLLSCGFVLYSIPEPSSDSTCGCPCTTNIVAAEGETNTSKHKVCEAAIQGLSSMNKSLSSFFPSRGGYDEGVASKSCKKPLWYDLLYWSFHFLAIIYMISIFAAVFGVELINRIVVGMKCIPWPRMRIRLSRTFRPNAMNVFWEVCEESRMMCENAIAAKSANLKKESIVFVLPETSHSWLRLKDDDSVVQSLVRKGFTWIIGNAEEPGSLVAASRHFFLGTNGHKNLSQAEILMTRLEKDISNLNCRRKRRQCDLQMSIYVRAWAEADDDFMYRWADEWNRRLAKSDIGIAVEIVREEAIVSRKFLIEHSMLDCPNIKVDTKTATVSGEFRILVLGFGAQGERLVGDMICDAQFVRDKGKPVPIAVDVIDSDPASFGWFKANCTEACSRYQIRFRCMNAKQTAFWKWLAVQPQYNRVVICTQDDVVNLELANDIANYFSTNFKMTNAVVRDTIFVRTRNPMLARPIKTTLSDGKCPYQTFGCLADTYTENSLLNDKWNDGAIFVNGIWGARYDKEYKLGEDAIQWYKTHGGREYGQRCWRVADTFNRESSRASFIHQRNLLRLIGYRASAKRQEVDKAKSSAPMPSNGELIGQIKGLMREGEKLRNLSESEHMRWMAFHFVRGWQKWDPKIEELEQLAGTVTKKKVEPSSINKLAHKHAALVDFCELGKVDAKFNIVNRKNGQGDINPSMKKDDDLVYGVEAVFDAGFMVAKMEGSENGK